MSNADRFMQYAEAFEEAYLDEDWSRLEPFFAEDATYRSFYGADLEVTGRANVIEQLQSDTDAFDRKFDARHLEFAEGPVEAGERVSLVWKLTYAKANAPDLFLAGTETATFRGDRIVLLEGSYAPETFGEFGAWLGKYGGFLHDD
jgi:hypothetical protein